MNQKRRQDKGFSKRAQHTPFKCWFCHKTIEGKFGITRSGNFMCKSCKENYRKW